MVLDFLVVRLPRLGEGPRGLFSASPPDQPLPPTITLKMPTILQNHYVLAVHDMRQSAAFYTEALGFHITATPAGWIFLARDNCMIMLGECPDDLDPNQLGCHRYFAYLKVDDADAWHAELQAKAIPGIGPITTQPWGMREFAIHTPDGHRLMVGHHVSSR